jgi:hypothetical protein
MDANWPPIRSGAAKAKVRWRSWLHLENFFPIIFRPYIGPDEPPTFDPDDYPVN